MAEVDADVDIRGGLDDIADAIRAVSKGLVCEIYNSDEDMEDAPAPRAVMLSRERMDELLEYEFRYESVSK